MTSKTDSRRAKIWTKGTAAVVVDLERVFIDAQANATKQSKITVHTEKLTVSSSVTLFSYLLRLTIALRRI